MLEGLIYLINSKNRNIVKYYKYIIYKIIYVTPFMFTWESYLIMKCQL